MCNLTENLSMHSFTGYKVVYKLVWNYYSIATGIKYEIGKLLPESKKITPISIGNYFKSNILNEDSGWFSPEMSGRTCVFRSFFNASKMKDDILAFLEEYGEKKPHGSFKVVKVTLEIDLMAGLYPLTEEVVAGRMITKIVEI